MPDPFLVIVGCIAILAVVLYPIRRWRQRRHRYDVSGDDDSITS